MIIYGINFRAAEEDKSTR